MTLQYLPNSSNKKLSVNATIKDLKESNTDFEWYPTTDKMIDAVINDVMTARDYKLARSILDVGAGDARVLEAFYEHPNLDFTDFFGIEKSPSHVSRWDTRYTFIGGNFYESDVAANSVSVIFSNPPYGDFERWAARLIQTSYAKVIYLVLPARWRNSQVINNSLKGRGLYAKTILSDNFITADRKARAVVEVVRVTSDKFFDENYIKKFMTKCHIEKTYYSYFFNTNEASDPIDAWFSETFPNLAGQKTNKGESTKESSQKAIVPDVEATKKESTIDELVAAYEAQANRVLSNYKALDNMDRELFFELGIGLETIKNTLKDRMESLRNQFWNKFVHNYEPITNRLTRKYQDKVYENLIERAKTIPFNATNALIITQSVIRLSNEYADDQVKDFFYELSNPKYVTLYKSNKKVFADNNWRYSQASSERANRYTLDYRIIQSCLFGLSADRYNDFKFYDVNQVLSDICTVARLIGMQISPAQSTAAMLKKDVSAGERITVNYRKFKSEEETELFAIKFFTNTNQHIFLSKEFAMRLNIYIGKLLGWVTSAEAAYSDMAMKDVSKEHFESIFEDTKSAPIQFKGSNIAGLLAAS